MVFIDIVFAILLGFAVYKGFKNGFFVEVASFVGLLVGIYFALKFSNWMGAVFSEIVPTWNPHYLFVGGNWHSPECKNYNKNGRFCFSWLV